MLAARQRAPQARNGRDRLTGPVRCRAVSSRAEEKERRRQERLAAEQAAQSSRDRRKRLAFVGAGVLVVAVIAIIVLAVASGGGGDDGEGTISAGDAPPIPAVQIADLTEAAKAAGCEVKEWSDDGSSHTSEKVTYKTNPATSGAHNPEPAADGVYEPGNEPAVGNTVHSLEHGRIEFQYKPGTPTRTIAQLEQLFNEKVKGQEGYHSLLFQNQTTMTAAVAATAWTKSITCPSMNDKVFDALRAFRKDNVDKAPEFVP